MRPGCGLEFWIQDGDCKHPLIFGVNTIGRMQDNVVVLDDMHVSRHHCAIIVHRNGNCEVHDIASKNGTILNGKVVAEPTPIRPGDVLNLSNHRIVLRAALARIFHEWLACRALSPPDHHFPRRNDGRCPGAKAPPDPHAGGRRRWPG
jgi:hypothetical protein